MNRHSQNKFPPGPKGRFPWLRLGRFSTPLPNILLELGERYGDMVHFRVGQRHVYLLNHPDFIQEVLVTQQRYFSKGRAFQHTRQLLGNGLLTDEGQSHLEQRRILQPVFHKRQLPQYDQIIVGAAKQMSISWQVYPEGQPLDLASELTNLSMQIISQILFSTSIDDNSDILSNAIQFLLKRFESIISPSSLLREGLPAVIKYRRQIQQAKGHLTQFIDRMIFEHTHGHDQQDVLAHLQRSNRLTDQQIRDHLMTLFIAGHETTASALSWTFYLLAQNPIAAKKVQAELTSVLAGRSARAEDYDPLVYTRMVFSESLRLYPPAWIIGRQAKQDVSIGGYQIHSGSTVLLSQWVTHHDPRYYSHPFAFIPERWTPDTRAKRPKMAFFPFGAGQRLCIGEQLAWLTGVLTLATILQDWSFHPIPGLSMSPQFTLTLRPKKGAVVIPIALD